MTLLRSQTRSHAPAPRQVPAPRPRKAPKPKPMLPVPSALHPALERRQQTFIPVGKPVEVRFVRDAGNPKQLNVLRSGSAQPPLVVPEQRDRWGVAAIREYYETRQGLRFRRMAGRLDYTAPGGRITDFDRQFLEAMWPLLEAADRNDPLVCAYPGHDQAVEAVWLSGPARLPICQRHLEEE